MSETNKGIQRTPAASAKRWRWLAGLAVATIGAAGVFIVWQLDRAVQLSRQCFEQIERRPQVELPPCEQADGTLGWLAELPPTARPAKRLRAELGARWAIARYVDAAVGFPSAAGLSASVPPLVEQNKAMTESGELFLLDELGRSQGGAELGRWALRTGDAATLLAQPLPWQKHDVIAATYRAGLLLGDDRIHALAQRHIEHDSFELRMRSAALLCIDGKAPAAIEALKPIEQQWAEKRSANFWHHFGEIRVVLESCAAVGAVAAPAVPSYGYAGAWDQRERVFALRMRVLARRCDDGRLTVDCRRHAAVDAAFQEVREWLRADAFGIDKQLLLASVASAFAISEELIEVLPPAFAKPSPAAAATDELGLATRGLAAFELSANGAQKSRSLRLADPLAPALHPVPFVAAQQLEAAALHVQGLAARLATAAASSADAPLLGPSPGPLRRLARGWLVEAAYGYARIGDRVAAERSASAALQGASATQRGLLLATLANLGGRFEAAVDLLKAPPQGEPALQARYLLERAAARLPGEAAAKDLTVLEKLLPQLKTASLREALARRALWLAALSRSGKGSPAAESAGEGWIPPPHVPLSPQLSRLQEGRALESLTGWTRAAVPRVAQRYAAHRKRGQPAHSLAAYFALGGRLADDNTQLEPWLDALGARALGALPLRWYAFSRARAAYWRGDTEARKLWWRRYRQLETKAHDDRLAELYRALGV